MDGSTIALVLLVPAAAVFIYAGWSEYRRYRAEGPSSYGLTYDPETNTTHVGPLADGESGFDPEEFEPVNQTEPGDDSDGVSVGRDDNDDQTEQDKRT
jgi:hypothetical protein